MLRKVKRTLVFLDDLLEVLVVKVLFSRKSWKLTTAVLLAALSLTVWGLPERFTMSAADYAQRGYQRLVRGEVSRAIRDLKKATRMAPDQAYYQQLLGLAHLQKTEPHEALSRLHRALRLQPSRRTMFFLGCAYQSLKLHETAIGVFREMRSHDPRGLLQDAEPYHGYEPIAEAKIGECYVRMGRFAMAVDHLHRAVSLYPHHPHAYFYLGIAFWEQGNPDLSVEQFFRVIELAPQESAAVYNVACYYSIKGQPDLALTWLEKSFQAGFNQFKHIATDKDLDPIRHLPRFNDLVERYRARLPHEP